MKAPRTSRVIEALADVMVIKGVPEHIRSDNGPEFVARDLRKWLANTGAKTLYIEPGSPWENGYCESFNSKLRDEFLNGEIFYSMKEIRVLAERWRIHYNTIRPHSSLGYRPPAPESWQNETKTGYGEMDSKVRFPLPPHPQRWLLDRKRSCATLITRGTKDRADQLFATSSCSQRFGAFTATAAVPMDPAGPCCLASQWTAYRPQPG
jgi:hypothetical protein